MSQALARLAARVDSVAICSLSCPDTTRCFMQASSLSPLRVFTSWAKVTKLGILAPFLRLCAVGLSALSVKRRDCF